MKVKREFVRNGEAVSVTAERLDGDNWRVHIGERVLEVTAHALGDGGVRIVPIIGTETIGTEIIGTETIGTETQTAAIAYGVAVGKQFMVRINGQTHTLELPTGRGRGSAGAGDGIIRAPMTGTVLEVQCKPGDDVAADQTLVVLSAMKMEHQLTAGVAGVVQSVDAVVGTTVDQGATLVTVEAAKKSKQ